MPQSYKDRKERWSKAGRCYSCGKFPPDKPNGICPGCREYLRQYAAYRSGREEKPSRDYLKNGLPPVGRTAPYSHQTIEEKVEKRKARDKYRRDECFIGYGGRCVYCGNDNLNHLVLHHPNGNGKIHRDAVGGYGSSFYKSLIDLGFPDDVELACANCHLEIHRGIVKSHRSVRGCHTQTC